MREGWILLYISGILAALFIEVLLFSRPLPADDEGRWESGGTMVMIQAFLAGGSLIAMIAGLKSLRQPRDWRPDRLEQISCYVSAFLATVCFLEITIQNWLR